MLEPFVEAGTLVLLNASAAAMPQSATPAGAALVPLFEVEWPPSRCAWLAGEARRDEAAQVQACLPHARDAGPLALAPRASARPAKSAAALARRSVVSRAHPLSLG